MSAAAPLRVRPAGMGDYEALCPLFDELDEFHRRARPELFQPFPRPVRPREQVARWLADAGSTIVVAENGEGVVGLVLLMTRPPSPFAGAVPRKVVDIDNIVVRADQRRRRIGRRLIAAAVGPPVPGQAAGRAVVDALVGIVFGLEEMFREGRHGLQIFQRRRSARAGLQHVGARQLHGKGVRRPEGMRRIVAGGA